MSRYDLWSAAAGSWLVLFGTAIAILVAWSTVGITRWILDLITGWVLNSIAPIRTEDTPTDDADISRLDRLDGVRRHP